MPDLTAKVTGTLTIAPSANATPTDGASTGCTFGLSLRTENQAPKNEISQSNAVIDSPASFVVQPFPAGLQARVFYFRRITGGPYDIRLTQLGAGAKTLDDVNGVMLVEVDAGEHFTQVEVQGAGTFEWAAFGPNA